MAKPVYELTDYLKELIVSTRDQLSLEAGNLEEMFSEASEKWQESDKGIEISAWLEKLDNITHELDNINEKE